MNQTGKQVRFGSSSSSDIFTKGNICLFKGNNHISIKHFSICFVEECKTIDDVQEIIHILIRLHTEWLILILLHCRLFHFLLDLVFYFTHFNGGRKYNLLKKTNLKKNSLAKFSDPSFAADPRSRSYHAYREWQRLSALKDAQSIPMRDSSNKRYDEK